MKSAQQQNLRTLPDIGNAFAQFVGEAGKLAFMDGLRGDAHGVASSADEQIAGEREHVAGEIEKEHAAQANGVVNKSHDGAGDQPAALHSGDEKAVGLQKCGFRCEFLNQRRDCGPEHPEAGGHQNAHQINFPQRRHSAIREYGHGKNDQCAAGVEGHHQPPAVFTINHHACEGKHQQSGNGLQHEQRAQSDLGVGGLQDVPGHGSRIHSAAHHGDEIGREDEPQAAMLENIAHVFNLAFQASE